MTSNSNLSRSKTFGSATANRLTHMRERFDISKYNIYDERKIENNEKTRNKKLTLFKCGKQLVMDESQIEYCTQTMYCSK